jgi:RNA polymerase sigma-70 factor (ECF subfamily)
MTHRSISELRSEATQGTTAEELLAAVCAHDREALGQLYVRFAPSLLGMALRTLGDRGAAEAAVEEVFLRLWSGSREADSRGASVSAYLLLSAHASAVRRLRAQRGLMPSCTIAFENLDACLAWLPHPEEIALLDGRRELLKKLMKQLPASQREALDLVVFQGYTETEIAERLHQPLGRVRSELRAGLRFLRHRLKAVLGTWSANI